MSETNSPNQGFHKMLQLGLILALYSVAACAGLAFVYSGTAKVIARRQQTDLETTLGELFPAADSFMPITGVISPNPSVVIEEDSSFAALCDGKIIGAALRIQGSSYGGAIKILVGVGADNRISAVRVLEHKDTPGLGANAVKPAFYNQFTGKSSRDPFEPKNDVNVITSATITTKAVADSVKAAALAASAWFAAGGVSR